MATNNNWSNAVSAANVSFTGGTFGAATDSTDNAVNIGTGASSGRTVTIGNATGTSTVAVNCGTGGVTVGTSANAHTTTLGSTNSTSATTVQSGSGALNITATNGALTINAGTGTLGIATDASANTVNIATGGAVKTFTIGSTNTTSATSIKSGSGNIAMNSGLTVDSSGRNYNTVQPAFLANLGTSTSNNVTGDGTTYTVLFDTKIFDQGTNFSTGTGAFTAPITGKYQFNASIMIENIGAAHTTGQLQIKTTNNVFDPIYESPVSTQASGNFLILNGSTLANMTAGDTAVFQAIVSGSTKTIGIHGNTMNGSNQGFTFVSGYLVC